MYEFKHVSPYDNTEVVMTIDEDCLESWPEIVEKFQDFLVGCGFIINKCELDFKEVLESEHQAVMARRNEAKNSGNCVRQEGQCCGKGCEQLCKDTSLTGTVRSYEWGAT